MRLCCSARCPHKKDIELLLIIWSVFVLVFTIKGYWQKTMVSAPKTSISCTCWADGVHISSGRVSAISCFSDAANYGVHAAMSAVVFAISAFFVESKWLRIYFLCIAVGGLYGMGISGTRAAMGVIMGGMLMITVIAKIGKRYWQVYSYPSAFSCSSVIPISEAGTNISTRCAPLSIRPKTLPTRCVSKTGKE